MPKIDLKMIEGYEDMSAEEKLKALENLDIPDPDYTGYVKKEVFDKTASDLSAAKKELREKLSEEERKSLEADEKTKELEEKYQELLRKSNISENKSKFLALGYEEKLAEQTATAMTDGDLETVFKNEQKHLASFEKKIRAEALKDTPSPTGDGVDEVMTLEKFRKLSPQERASFAAENPEDYKAMYSEGDS